MSKHSQAAERQRGGFDLGRLLLEGRAFFALIAIIIIFSALSPVYFSTNNFLTMSSHVAIFGLLSIGMLLGRLEIITVLVLLTPAFWRH